MVSVFSHIKVWGRHQIGTVARAVPDSDVGKRNQVVEFVSRYKPPPGEWRLHPEVVHSIWGLFSGADGSLHLGDPLSPLILFKGEDLPPGSGCPGPHVARGYSLRLFTPSPDSPGCFDRVLLVAPFWPARTWFLLLHRLRHGMPWRLSEGGCRKRSLSSLPSLRQCLQLL